MDRDVKRVKVLGIDPGYDRLGFAVIAGSNIDNFSLLTTGLITTSPKQTYRMRLKAIFADLNGLFRDFDIDIVAIEKLFFWRNITTAFKVGMAMGAVLLAMDTQDLLEVHPVRLKKFISGSGRASKKAIMNSLRLRFNINVKAPDDVWDAIAIAIFGLYNYSAKKSTIRAESKK